MRRVYKQAVLWQLGVLPLYYLVHTYVQPVTGDPVLLGFLHLPYVLVGAAWGLFIGFGVPR